MIKNLIKKINFYNCLKYFNSNKSKKLNIRISFLMFSLFFLIIKSNKLRISASERLFINFTLFALIVEVIIYLVLLKTINNNFNKINFVLYLWDYFLYLINFLNHFYIINNVTYGPFIILFCYIIYSIPIYLLFSLFFFYFNDKF